MTNTMSEEEKMWERCKMGLRLELDPKIVKDVINVVEQYTLSKQIEALESTRVIKYGKTYSDATDWKHEVELQEEELSRLIKEYKGN